RSVRDPDGLALSSRNRFLSEAERKEAPRLHAVLNQVRDTLRGGAVDVPAVEQDAQRTLAASGWKVDYVSVRRRRDLKAPEGGEVAAGEPLVGVAAAKLGTTRLSDNLGVWGL